MRIEEYLNNIQQKLTKNFDIERSYHFNNFEFDLFAKYHQRDERYILSKKATIYAIESNEFCFVKYLSYLDERYLVDYYQVLIASIDKLINPTTDHMSSVITGVIVVDDEPNVNIIKLVKDFKYHKGFALGFKGWVDIRLLLIALDSDNIVTNKKGKEVSQIYSI